VRPRSGLVAGRSPRRADRDRAAISWPTSLHRGGRRDHAARTGSATRSESIRCCRRSASVTIARGWGVAGPSRIDGRGALLPPIGDRGHAGRGAGGRTTPTARRSAIPRSAPRPGATPGCAQPRPPVAMVGGAWMTRPGYAASAPPPGAGPSPTAPPRTGAHHAPFRSRCRRASARHRRHPDALAPGDRRMTSYEVDAALAPDLASPQGPRFGAPTSVRNGVVSGQGDGADQSVCWPGIGWKSAVHPGLTKVGGGVGNHAY
jgi:hypothetical protein